MIPISQLFRRLFPAREPVFTLVQTNLEPVHENKPTEGSEFLDDFERMEDEPTGETD